MKNEKLRMKNLLDVDYMACTSRSQRLINSSFLIFHSSFLQTPLIKTANFTEKQRNSRVRDSLKE